MTVSIVNRLFGPFIAAITAFFEAFPSDIGTYFIMIFTFVIVVACKRVFIQ